ncbi:class II fructose-bisphosphate aldolase family protein [Tetragenococcus koreensis]|uniref:Ketose-bisphosphate aldolase n=1 Tax=Tetragenococcus koreensis TaxID=290335 RepID=A0AAN4ZP45_9ENTE|nr:class II fructose-bisphosphate aldolase [Tetragenococcus koreensis]MDN6729871.1 class II fructose-bisphosphate aldolase family protein [Alkalibacterium sp.]AYW46630.1 ketose-bisphosphate aldolase [Tetragenococcus koreensis]MCF1586254.1 class II fructose-bisphosphate aldolase family protein [Tetragenococcus koreensis]MCF1615842.1 class II fructose-bisphosphate aldolase family protein [Tetragenococcus koreensis]MCF1619136.1 class II fructose-bisphosphate aldolase family protein [Tetragenococc
MYKTLKEVTQTAEELNMTIGAFNAHNLEMMPEMIRAAKEMGSPIIIQTSIDTAKYIGYPVVVAVARALADNEMVDVVLHLDHAKDFDEIKAAIDAGYSSVMFDGSALPFKENIAKTKAVVSYAHNRGVSVEGEIGTIGGTEEGISVPLDEEMYTQPGDAVQFVKETGVDALAVAIGTNHGQFKSKTDVKIPLLRSIHEKVAIPLVVHGGTGVKEEDYPELINNGIRKFNVGTELLVGWTQEAIDCFGATEVNKSLRHNIIPANMKVKETVKHKIGLFMNLAEPMNVGRTPDE